MTTVYTVNKKNPTQVHVIKDFVKSDEANYSNDVLFYRQEDALEFVEFMDDFVSYNIEVDVKTIGFASYGTTVELKMSSKPLNAYFGLPTTTCDHCDKTITLDEIHHLDAHQDKRLCTYCYDNCSWCSLCKEIITDDKYDGYCSNCY